MQVLSKIEACESGLALRDVDEPTPGQGEIHHSVWWYHQGRTSTANAILLCWYHHTLVHQRHLSITRHTRADADQPSWWTFTDPDGRRVEHVPPPAVNAPDPEPPQPPLRQ